MRVQAITHVSQGMSLCRMLPRSPSTCGPVAAYCCICGARAMPAGCCVGDLRI